MKKKGRGLSHKTWQDLYYDGDLDMEFEEFDEYTQTIHKRKRNIDGWDNLEEYKDEELYWEMVERDYRGVKY